MDECIKMQNVPNGSGGVLYVTGTYASLPWEFHVWESVVSSAWMYLLIKIQRYYSRGRCARFTIWRK